LNLGLFNIARFSEMVEWYRKVYPLDSFQNAVAAALGSKYRDGCGVGITDISVASNSFEIVLARTKLVLTSSFSWITASELQTLTLAHPLTIIAIY